MHYRTKKCTKVKSSLRRAFYFISEKKTNNGKNNALKILLDMEKAGLGSNAIDAGRKFLKFTLLKPIDLYKLEIAKTMVKRGQA